VEADPVIPHLAAVKQMNHVTQPTDADGNGHDPTVIVLNILDEKMHGGVTRFDTRGSGDAPKAQRSEQQSRRCEERSGTDSGLSARSFTFFVCE